MGAVGGLLNANSGGACSIRQAISARVAAGWAVGTESRSRPAAGGVSDESAVVGGLASSAAVPGVGKPIADAAAGPGPAAGPAAPGSASEAGEVAAGAAGAGIAEGSGNSASAIVSASSRRISRRLGRVDREATAASAVSASAFERARSAAIASAVWSVGPDSLRYRFSSPFSGVGSAAVAGGLVRKPSSPMAPPPPARASTAGSASSSRSAAESVGALSARWAARGASAMPTPGGGVSMANRSSVTRPGTVGPCKDWKTTAAVTPRTAAIPP